MLEFSSTLPDNYFVLSGPIESYRSFPFNSRLHQRLVEKLGSLGIPEAGTPTRLRVHLAELTTDYDRLGSSPFPPQSPLKLASLSTQSLAAFDFDEDAQGDPTTPLQITQSARLTLEVDIQSAAGPSVKERVVAEAQRVTLREHLDYWSYDYGPLLQEVIAKAANSVAKLLPIKN